MMNVDKASPYRCAIYFAPATDSPWWAAGSQWLGRCAATHRALEPPPVEGVDAQLLRRVTAEPRRYGWHGTLKAPFQLAAGCSLADLRSALRQLCAALPAFTLPALRVVRMDRFLALRPAEPSKLLDAVATACVMQLHPLARLLDEPQLRRRRDVGLTPQQDALLMRWGYPWVLEQFRFHLSLTGDLSDVPLSVEQALMRTAQERFETLPPCRFDSVALFTEPRAGEDFELLEHVELRG
jgi:hypothetical protein